MTSEPEGQAPKQLMPAIATRRRFTINMVPHLRGGPHKGLLSPGNGSAMTWHQLFVPLTVSNSRTFVKSPNDSRILRNDPQLTVLVRASRSWYHTRAQVGG